MTIAESKIQTYYDFARERYAAFGVDTEAALAQLEKVAIKETRYRNTQEYYQVYLRFAVVFFLGWLFTKNTFLTNALED